MMDEGREGMRILTNHPGQEQSPTWKRHSTYLPVARMGYASSIMSALKLYGLRNAYDCVVIGAWRSDFVFGLLQGILPFRKAPAIMIDCLWYDTGTPIKRHARRLFMKIMDRGIDRYCVWATREIEAYSRAFGLPPEKFVFVPYHTTINGIPLETCEGDYLFSGGNFQRDYSTLLKAVRELPVRLEIGCTRKDLFEDIEIPRNVRIRGYSHKDYLKMMAGCRINIVPLDVNHLHSGGQQTILNSMWLGKPTIVTDPEGARDYITHGEDGLLVAPGNPHELADAIQTLLQDPQKARDMGTKARSRVIDRYSTDAHFREIVAIAGEVAAHAR